MLQRMRSQLHRALKLIKVEYEEYPVEIHPRKSMYGSNPPIHFDKKDNVLVRSNYFIGNVDKGMEESETVVKGTYKTPIVQHCHIENPISYAYMEKGPDRGCDFYTDSAYRPSCYRPGTWESRGAMIRVIKPYIGGGFGNKQDVLYEPLNAFLTTQVGGRPVKLDVTREETFCNTRTRHSMNMILQQVWTRTEHFLQRICIRIPIRVLMPPMVMRLRRTA